MKKCEKCFYYLQHMGMVEELKALKAQVREWAEHIISCEWCYEWAKEMREAAGGEE